jgi:hypothetical protein
LSGVATGRTLGRGQLEEEVVICAATMKIDKLGVGSLRSMVLRGSGVVVIIWRLGADFLK